ncbi:hypothetical protein [Caminibacter sp.]
MKKKSLILLLPLALMAADLNNSSAAKKPEQGWRFGDNPVSKTKGLKEDKRTIKQILAEMLKVQKKQLKTQKKILAILEEQFNPKPKVITLPNGKKCIANSSAECFQMPLTPVAKRIPVLKNWLLKRDEKSAAEYIKWQSKYLQEISKAAYAYDFAVTEYGNKVAKVDYSQPGFEETFGYTSVVRNKYNNMLLDKYKNKFKIYLFMGMNPDLDVYSFTSIAKFINSHPKLHYVIVFKNEKEKKAFLDAAKIFPAVKKAVENKNVQISVAGSVFKKLNIYTTPTVSVKLNNTNTVNKIMVGRLNGVLTQKILNFLKFKGVIKEGENPTYKAWQKAGDYSSKYYDHYYDVNINPILKLYKGEK